jgi:hypothetical protein
VDENGGDCADRTSGTHAWLERGYASTSRLGGQAIVHIKLFVFEHMKSPDAPRAGAGRDFGSSERAFTRIGRSAINRPANRL